MSTQAARVSMPDSPPSRRSLWIAFGVMFGVWLVMAWLDLDLRNEFVPGGIVSLELAFTPGRFSAIVDTWSGPARSSVWWSLGIDFAFMASYGTFLSRWVHAAAIGLREHSPMVSRWGRSFARLVWLGVALDAVENLALAYALSGPDSLVAPVLTAGICATLKFVLLIAALFYALNGSVAMWLGQARMQDQPGSST